MQQQPGGGVVSQLQERQRMNSMLSEARKRVAREVADDDEDELDAFAESGAALPPLSNRKKRAGFFDAGQIYAEAQEDRMDMPDVPPLQQQQEDTQENEDNVELKGLPSRVEMLQTFGSAGGQDKCFGCVYNIASKQKTVAVYNDDIVELFDMPRRYMGQACPKTIVRLMAERYEKIREKTNSRARLDEELLPPWREADIYECMYFHNVDYEVQNMLRLFENSEIRRTILEKGVMEVNPKTGVEQVNQKALNCLAKLQEMDGKITQRDPKKQLFYSDGARLDVASMKRGIVSTSKKNVKSFYQTGHHEPGSAMGIL
jgi:hypothetical protein